jgi:hypothetical protein
MRAALRLTVLCPDPTPLCAPLSAVVASFDTAKPCGARFPILISPAVQPSPAFLALQEVYARLREGIYTFRHPDQGEVPVDQVIANVAPP